MALTLEDGTCIAAANAFVSRAALLAWAADYYPDLTIADDGTTDAAIMRASQWLSTFPDWDGTMTCGRGLQGLAWPRSGVTDCNGDAIPDDEVPTEVEQATFYATVAEIESPGVLTPSMTPGKQTKREKVDVIEVEYMTPSDQGATSPKDPTETLRPVLTAVYDLLKCLASFPNGVNVPWPWVA
jgi:hypothetical protein